MLKQGSTTIFTPFSFNKINIGNLIVFGQENRELALDVYRHEMLIFIMILKREREVSKEDKYDYTKQKISNQEAYTFVI